MSFTVVGYGSLVNRATLPPYRDARPVTVPGWQRAWRASGRTADGRGVCSLSVVPAPGQVLEGLALTFDDEAWPVIQAREARYDGVRLPDGAILFRAEAAIDRWGDREHPIHLSYVDVVLRGFRQEFGAEGVARFMTSTLGWEAPVLDDRAAPLYPRAQRLSAEETRMVDDALGYVDARVVRADDTGMIAPE